MKPLPVFLLAEQWDIILKEMKKNPEIHADIKRQLDQNASEDYRLSGAWLTQEDQQYIVTLWNTEKTREHDNPRVRAIQFINEKALPYGWSFDLSERVKIKDNLLKLVTPTNKLA